RESFRTSAPKEENGFVQGENCFVTAFATKHTRRNCEYFQCAENAVISVGQKFLPRRIGLALCLVAGRRKQVAAAPDGADHRRFCRVRLDLAADAHDTKI